MDPKRSLSPPKPNKKLRKKKSPRQIPKTTSLTEPNQPQIPILQDPVELPFLETESPSIQDFQQEEIYHKEASALDCLRELSEDSNRYRIDNLIEQLDQDLDPLESSDTLSPFTGSKKKKRENINKTEKGHKPLIIPNTSVNIQAKIPRESYKANDNTRDEGRKRVRSEPNEGNRTLKPMQGKSYQFVYPKIWAKGVTNKLSFATNMLVEVENNNQRKELIEEKSQENDLKATEAQVLPVINNVKEKVYQKLPSVLQIRKLVRHSYSQLLHDINGPQEPRPERQSVGLENENANQVLSNQAASKKILGPREKKILEAGFSNLQESPEKIMMVGRSLSVPKIPPGFENFLEKNVEAQRSFEKIRRKKNMRDKSYDCVGDMNQRYKEEDIWKQIDRRNIKDENTLNQSNAKITSRDKLGGKGLSAADKEESPKRREEKGIKSHKPKAKSELPWDKLEDKRVFSDLNLRDSKGIEDLKLTLFTSKKNMIGIASPEEEVQISQMDKLERPSASRQGKREPSIENKIPMEKNGRPKFKMVHVNNKKSKDTFGIILPEIQEALKLKLKMKDLNSNQKDSKMSNQLSRRNSLKDGFLKADMQSFSVKIPKFKAILKAVGKNIESERFSSPLRQSQPEKEITTERYPYGSNFTKKAL